MKKPLLIILVLLAFQMAFAHTGSAIPDHSAKSYLMINANIYYGAEDEQAVPIETEFYLLDESVIEILKQAKLKPSFPDGNRRQLTDEDYLQATVQALTANDAESKVVRLLIENELAAHKFISVKTDSAGTAYAPIPIGNYYLFGVGKASGQTLVWNTAIAVVDGRNNIEADQYNADLISED